MKSVAEKRDRNRPHANRDDATCRGSNARERASLIHVQPQNRIALIALRTLRQVAQFVNPTAPG
jgi:hypothetical protein